MDRRRLLPVALTALSALLGLTVLALPANAALVSVRYASPTGSGTTCSAAAPCDIETAVNKATSGQEVILNSGVYGSPAASLEQLGRSALTLNVHAANPAKPPLIYTGSLDSVGIVLPAGSHLAYVTVIDTNNESSVLISGTADHISVFGSQAENGVCRVTGTLSNSLCVASDQASSAVTIFPQTSDAALTLRNVTAITTSGGGLGLYATQLGTGNTTIQVTNSIIQGSAHDITAAPSSTGNVTVTTSHSDYDPASDTHAGIATITSGTGDITAAPVFASGPNPYAEAPASPTVNHGAPVPAGDTDLARLPRTLGSAPDIGAFELAQPPTAAGLAVTKKTTASLKVVLKVNPEGLKTSLTVTATRKHHHPVTVTKHGLSATTLTTVRLKLRGLKKGTTYHLKAVAKNGAGHASTKTVRATTKH